MMNNVGPNFQNRLDTIFARLNPTAVEEFYAAYQQWALQQRINELRQRIEAVRAQQADNQQRIRETQPSAIALAALARLQSNGVSDIELLDAMLERGESWLDQTMQRLDYFEQFEDFVSDDYTQWCQGALEGAFDWIDSLREDTEQEALLETSPEEELLNNENAGDVEALLLQRLATEDEQDDLAWQEAITLKRTAIQLSAEETVTPAPLEEPEQAVHEDTTSPETETALQVTEYIPQQAGEDEGDREGPHSAQPNPRLYHDDGNDSPGVFIVEAGANAEGGEDPRGRLRTTNVSGEEGEDTLVSEPEQPTLVEFASIEEPATSEEELLVNNEQPALIESAPTGEMSIDEIDEQPTIVEFASIEELSPPEETTEQVSEQATLPEITIPEDIPAPEETAQSETNEPGEIEKSAPDESDRQEQQALATAQSAMPIRNSPPKRGLLRSLLWILKGK